MKTKLTILFLLLATTMMAQEMKVQFFSFDVNDISALTSPVKDQNGDVCALVKVDFVSPEAKFKGDIVKTDYEDGIYYLYMSPGATFLNITAPKVPTLKYSFTEALTKGSTYSLVIDYPFYVYDMFEYISMCDILPENKNRDGYTETIRHNHQVHFAWPAQIAGMTEAEVSNMKRTLIRTLFGNDTSSLDIRKVLSDRMATARRSGKSKKNESMHDFYLERRQGNFLIFKEKSYAISDGIKSDISEHHLLYNTRTQKMITRIRDFGIDFYAVYKAMRQNLIKFYTEELHTNTPEHELERIPKLYEHYDERVFVGLDEITVVNTASEESEYEQEYGVSYKDLGEEFANDWLVKTGATK